MYGHKLPQNEYKERHRLRASYINNPYAMPGLRAKIIMSAVVLLGRRSSSVFAFTSSSSSSSSRRGFSSCSSRRSSVFAFTSSRSSSRRGFSSCSSRKPVSRIISKLNYQNSDHDGDISKTQPRFRANIMTMPLPELEDLVSSWGYPSYRAKQILDWTREKGVTDFHEMSNLPKALIETLIENANFGALELALEEQSKDGTRKRAYRLHDGQLIESVLMPYDDGRNTACISSQAGCAMGCVFCATGQMGFARQLSPDEIFEQVARFDSELKKEGERLSNIVMMGMGEPLANYKNVFAAIRRINEELGIGARKITVSTVGVVPGIRKLADEALQVRLAVSLHCASEEERDALLPANRRYGGIDELMTSVREYIEKTKRRVTFEWALIEGQNDDPSVARRLGRLLKRHGIRRDMAHINIIPLNPTGGFEGSPSGRQSLKSFVSVLDSEFGLSATPRMRRGIDIDAGCGQLKSSIEKRERKEAAEDANSMAIGTGRDSTKDLISEHVAASSLLQETTATAADLTESGSDVYDAEAENKALIEKEMNLVEFMVHENALDLDESEDEVNEELDPEEANRLIALVQTSFLKSGEAFKAPSKTDTAETAVLMSGESSEIDDASRSRKEETTIPMTEDEVRTATRKRKKLLKNIKAIAKLKDMQSNGNALNEEQKAKVAKEPEWLAQIDSIEQSLA